MARTPSPRAAAVKEAHALISRHAMATTTEAHEEARSELRAAMTRLEAVAETNGWGYGVVEAWNAADRQANYHAWWATETPGARFGVKTA